MEQLNKALTFSKDRGLTTGLSVWIPMTPIFASTPALEVWVSVLVTTLMVIATTLLDTTLEVE